MAKRLGLAGLVLGGLSVLTPNIAHANDNSSQPKIIATFEYESHRPEPEYKDKKFRYDIWSDGTISQEGKPRVKFSKIWFYDVDGDGKFGKAECDMLKSGKLIYMHPEFNRITNSELKNALEGILNEMELKDYLHNKIMELGREKETEKAEIPEEKIVPEGKVKTYWDFIIQANSNLATDSFGGSFGIRASPFKNKNIGLGALLDFGIGGNKTVDFYSETFSNGRTFSGMIEEKDVLLAGASAELQFANLIIGGGLDYCNSIIKTDESIKEGGEVLKSNTNSTPTRQVFGKVYAGFEVPINNWRVGAVAGYHGRNGKYFGLRAGVRLNPNKR